MSDDSTANPPALQPVSATSDVPALARGVRFAIVCGLLTLAYLNVRSALAIGHFSQIFTDMLGGKPLPAPTRVVVDGQAFLVALSFALPAAMVATLFMRGVARPFYFLGVLALAATVQCIAVTTALMAPLTEIIRGMSGGP